MVEKTYSMGLYGLEAFPVEVEAVTMNLAPADKKKEGPIYDLPLLVSLLKASRQLCCHTEDAIFLGELSLSGELRPIRGLLPMADKASGCTSPRRTPGRAPLSRGLRCTASGTCASWWTTCKACWSSLPPSPPTGRRRLWNLWTLPT